MSDSDDDWDADDWEAPDLNAEDGNDEETFEDEEDLTLKDTSFLKSKVKTQSPSQETAARRKRKGILQKKEEEERKRRERLEEAMKKIEINSGKELSDKQKQKLVVEKADNLLCEDLFGDLAHKNRPVPSDQVVLDGEDLMAGEGTSDDKGGKVERKKKPIEALQETLAMMSLDEEMQFIEIASVVAKKLNEQSNNSVYVVQFVEFLIKALSPTLDSAQYKSLSSACNVQKNKKQKEEQVGNKKKKKKSKKKIVKTQSDSAFIESAEFEDFGW